MEAELGWACIERFLEETPRPRARQVLSGYDRFLQEGARAVVASFNPVELSAGKDSLQVFVGGDDAEVAWRPATTADGSVVTPNACRMLDTTYECDLVADLVCRWRSGTRAGEYIIQDARLGSVPTMLRSAACALRNAPPEEMAVAGECRHDEGGYFVVEGGEKVLQAIDRMANDVLVVSHVDDPDRSRTVEWEGVVRVHRPGDARPLKLALQMSPGPNAAVSASFEVRSGGADSRRAVTMSLFTAFRVLGVDTDDAIVDLIDAFHGGDRMALELFLRTTAERSGATAGYSGVSAVQHLRSALSMGPLVRTRDVEAIVAADMLGTAGDLRAAQLAMYTGKFVAAVMAGRETNRDTVVMKRVDDAGAKMEDMFRAVYGEVVSRAATTLKVLYDDTRAAGKRIDGILGARDVPRVFSTAFFTDHLRSAIKGRWIAPGDAAQQDGVVHKLPRASLQAATAYTNRVTSSMRHTLLRRPPRALFGDTYGYTCPNHTPEGLHVGLVRHFTLLSEVSARGVDVAEVKAGLVEAGVLAAATSLDFVGVKGAVPVVVDGKVFGTAADPRAVVSDMRSRRRTGTIHPHVSVSIMPGDHLEVHADGGRVLRPLFIADEGALVARQPGWNDLLKGSDDAPAAIELVDPYEMECCLVAQSPASVGSMHTHAEINGNAIFSSVALLAPFADHNPSPRNVFSCKQATACASLYATNFALRDDTGVDLLHHGQRPLVSTRVARAFGVDEMPYGENAVIAIMCFSGYNQEDSVIFNAAAVQRGLFSTTHYVTLTCDEDGKERFAHPLAAGSVRAKGARYDTIDGNGLPILGSELHPGDAIVGKVSPEPDGFKDASLVSDVTIHGVVDRVSLIPISKGARRCKVRVADYRQPTVGDKFASRHGQKGIIGRLMSAEDMPWTEDGIVPDIIINPHALPSRMTVGHVLEALFSKAACYDGVDADGTAFMRHSLEDVNERLGAHAEMNGDEVMCAGQSGQQASTPTFLCPTYYMRLKQQVSDKVAAANGGRRMAVTGQPVQGRSNGGGIRMGEMEHDAMVAHGASAFIKETYVDRSDQPRRPFTFVDGAFSTENAHTRVHERHDQSAFSTDYFSAEIPVAFKTAVDELGAMGVGVKIGRRV